MVAMPGLDYSVFVEGPMSQAWIQIYSTLTFVEGLVNLQNTRGPPQNEKEIKTQNKRGKNGVKLKKTKSLSY